jgi:ribosomal protein L7Ae-like RNA K-turn-binding protein
MLDYAANGIEYWAVDRLRQAATETARSRGGSLDQAILSLVGTQDEAEIERFWQQVEGNLRSGKVRLIFVADSTSKELRRLVEFLNDKMSDVEVLAVEVKQFLGGDNQKALVSRVVGLTEAARMTKAENKTKRQTSRAEFLAKCTPQAAQLFERIFDLADQRGHKINWGEVGFSVRALVPKNKRLISFAYGFPSNEFQFYFEYLPMSKEDKQALRALLMQYRMFREAGEQTLKATLDEQSSPRIEKTFMFILDKIDEVIQTYQSSL